MTVLARVDLSVGNLRESPWGLTVHVADVNILLCPRCANRPAYRQRNHGDPECVSGLRSPSQICLAESQI